MTPSGQPTFSRRSSVTPSPSRERRYQNHPPSLPPPNGSSIAHPPLPPLFYRILTIPSGPTSLCRRPPSDLKGMLLISPFSSLLF
ncbi:hypothetical protein B296_00057307 [Ensete ventricosum]|uniref:Uncharacterized protein n=1 Tax=Ensete ventricosum TaxID=4639 RepID=A0A426XRW8_ENSVE|nr:hypothetical protein B296_00057307 [Ensete ventricosum]